MNLSRAAKLIRRNWIVNHNRKIRNRGGKTKGPRGSLLAEYGRRGEDGLNSIFRHRFRLTTFGAADPGSSAPGLEPRQIRAFVGFGVGPQFYGPAFENFRCGRDILFQNVEVNDCCRCGNPITRTRAAALYEGIFNMWTPGDLRGQHDLKFLRRNGHYFTLAGFME